jgi:sigma-E factor negative regulatory protein RseC
LEQIVRVYKLCDNGKAQIIHVRASACSGDCHECAGGCTAAKETMIIEADNPIGARVGDFVRMESDTKSVMAAVAVMYVLPLVLFFAGYALGAWMGISGGLAGSLGFILGLLIAIAEDRRQQKNQTTVYTLVGYADRL